VVTICDIDRDHLERAQTTVEKAQKKRPIGVIDYRRVLDARDLDAVVIAVPCDLHAKFYLDTLAAGKNLYGEKPMCLTVAEADAIVAAAGKSKSLMQVGFQLRMGPKYLASVAAIHQGELGPIQEIRAGYVWDWGPLKGWFSRRERSGDCMLEQACHTWDILNLAMKHTPLKAVGWGRRDLYVDRDPGRNVTDYYSAILEYPGGVICNYLHTWNNPAEYAKPGYYQRVIGRKAAIDLGTSELVDRNRPWPPDRSNAVAAKVKLKPPKVLSPKPEDETLIALTSFINSVRTSTPPTNSVHNGRDATLTGLLVRKAVDERRTVTWEEMLKTC